jgi:superfamily I DNA and/or RNA helicase
MVSLCLFVSPYVVSPVRKAEIVFATLSGAGMDCFRGDPATGSGAIQFDIVVIDEAAQAVELSTLIPLQYGYAIHGWMVVVDVVLFIE